MLCYSTVVSVLLLIIGELLSVQSQDVVGCGGFVQSEVAIDYSMIEMKLYTKQGVVKSHTECAPNNGYFLIPLYDKGTFILKIEPPVGWSFDPISVELHIDGNSDKCSKGEDINFIFKGFTVSGKIISRGRELGPSGVEVSLQANADTERKTTTTEGGFFSFAQVMPGSYQLVASHASWTFDNAKTEVLVTSSNVEVFNKLTVSGYDVKGHVLSDGEPIQDVGFLLFSKAIQQALPGCEQISADVVENVKRKIDVDVPLCHVKSGVDGLFVFPSVPSGEYTLVPYYQGELITFDVVPSKLKFSVNYKSVVLKDCVLKDVIVWSSCTRIEIELDITRKTIGLGQKTPFQVHGFSVSGQVVSAEGQGIGDVSISVDGGPTSKTTQEGVYVLNNITAGTYSVQATKENYFFDPLKVQVTPNTPRLPLITPAGYHLCGKLHIEEFPAGATQLKGRKVILQTEGAPLTARSVSTSLDGNGNFCFRVTAGVHQIQPVVTSQEASSGLAVTPKVKVVKVTNNPVLDVVFSQFRATITGTVKCIGGACSGVAVSLQAVANPDQSKRLAQVTDTPDGSTFTFKDVFPGQYKATVLQDAWCWHNKTLEFQVSESDIDDLRFAQSGFILKCSLSHNIKLFFSLESHEEVVGSFNLTKGINRFCLAEPGVYNLMPRSCHQFEQDVYKYNTSAPTLLTLTAVKHLLSGVIKTIHPVPDITVTIRSLKTKDVTTVGPLKMESNQESKGDLNNTKSEEIGKDFLYNFTHWGRRGEDFEVTPVSSELLFYPSTRVVTIIDDCPAAWAEFEGRQGVFIEGQVTPPLSGVEIFITSHGDTHTDIKVETNIQGRYRVGPLHGDVEYSLTASKPGYILSPVTGRKGHFQALKLGQIEIQVTDEEDQPLSAVLLSLSAGQFRSNNVTLDNGTMVFANLGPGQYFFRPMLKEYTFSPTSQMIEVAEGSTVQLQVKGKRVAFSCFGFISSLNGESEKGIAIEAVGLDSCESFQEETVSDQDGQYRLRGLQPGCMYRVRVKTGDSNPHVERASPSFIDIQVSGSDLQKVNMIVFRHINQFDITGNVLTDRQFLSTLKVTLYPENNQDSPVFTTHVGVASYFQFPSVPNDGQVYIVRLYSSLSTLNYQYTLPESTITATGVRAHVPFKFEPEQRKAEPEPTQGSILTLPLLVLLILLAVYHNKVIPILQQASQIMQGVPADQLQVPLDDPFRNKKKTQQIRRR